ncbi:UDP-glucose 4-epimerase GalE [Pseudobacteriovorax antillogorgiicola]|uniref:UDP-glucose 4-epimerase n=1 Tax=Pseudobacteriovorax antillogorgiicola TaxID=1513793 RepID=A0A1Y6C2U2_9BACT|nr:UDP-glucose 4-epimerase GalE [Pseudobacteriovorax antillogorgiicola]TCS50304.1 UDP-galactose 4-epimerase [Pseudobacteriovorax antillogorgiicola]SMF34017.1 UDP-galactose 4-epimerase [Pseudobacteriovorax antillogorgiicola]
MKFLVIGGAGYIGSHFIYEAIEQGYQCIALDNLSEGHRQALHPDCDFVEGDLLDLQLLKKVIVDVNPDAVFHFAAYALVGESVSDPSKYYRNNVEGVRTLLEAMREQCPQTPLVFSSTCAVFGVPESLPMKENDPKKPISPYGRSKLMAEYLIEDYANAYGIKGMALRYFNACGAHESARIGEAHRCETHLIPNVIKSTLGGKPLVIFGDVFDTPDGTCVRDYIHVKDLAIAHIKAAEILIKKPKGFYDVYQLGTGQGYSNLEIVKTIEKVVGRPVEFSYGDPRPGDPPALYTAVEKAREGLGFEAQYSSLDYIIRTAIAWHEAHPDGF